MPEVESDPKTCLKCGYQRRSADAGPIESCPSCGAIYAKVEAAQRAKDAQAQAAPASTREPRSAPLPTTVITPQDIPEFIDEDRRRMTHLVYFLYLLPTGVSAFMAYAIAKSLKDEYQDEIAAAHNEWQYNSLAQIIWIFAAAVLVGLIVAAAQGGYLLTHDASLHHFAQRGGRAVLAVAAALYLWTLLRTLRGWFHLARGEGP